MRYGERVLGLDGLGFGVVRKPLGGGLAYRREAQCRLRSAATAGLAVERKSELNRGRDIIYNDVWVPACAGIRGRVAIRCKTMLKSCQMFESV